MKNLTIYLHFSLILLFGLTSCGKESTPPESNVNNNSNNNPTTTTKDPADKNNEWLIPIDEVRDGGPGKDGIPSIDTPEFAPLSTVDFLEDDDLIIGIKVGDKIRAYPHTILDWHEIVNDRIGEDLFAITYCPLTGTAIGWDRIVDGASTTFGVSGLLYNSNLIPYDRATDSNWSQMRLECVNGAQINTAIKTYPLIETSRRTWTKLYPDVEIMTTETGFSRPYGQYPYGNYKTSNSLIFNVSPEDERLHKKERVLGVIIGGEAKIYRFKTFDEGKVTVRNTSFNGQLLVVAGSEIDNFMVAYKTPRDANGDKLVFEAASNYPDAIFEDNEGNQWDLFGEAIAGPRKGQRLGHVNSYIGYWFAWGAFYPQSDIF